MALQKTLRGLANFVGLYEGGSLHMDLFRGVVPVINAETFLEPTTYQGTSSVLVAVGTVIGFTVPVDECWNLKMVGLRSIPLLATDDEICAPCVDPDPSQSFGKVGLQENIMINGMKNTGDIFMTGWSDGAGMHIAPGGFAGGMLTMKQGASNALWQCVIGYTKIKL